MSSLIPDRSMSAPGGACDGLSVSAVELVRSISVGFFLEQPVSAKMQANATEHVNWHNALPGLILFRIVVVLK